VAARVLGNLGVKLETVREAVEFIVGRGERPSPTEIGLTPRAKKVMELAVEEARRLNHSYIGTEHLLLGLVREGEGIAFGVLESLGVTLERVRVETIGIMSRTSFNQPSRWALVQLAPDSRRRKQAADLINGAKELLEAQSGSPVEQTFVRGFLIPRLDRLWHALSESSAPDEAEKRRAEVMAEASILGDLAEAFRAEASNDVADALTAALDGMKDALPD
jgi:ATP-dependent Clp protease ATP-binding subunit ClpA